MPLPCGIYEGKTINRVMQDNPSYLAWFVDNIHRFEGRTAVIDTVVAQITSHSRFPRVWAKYWEVKAAERKKALQCKGNMRQRERAKRRSDWLGKSTPPVQLLDRPLLDQLFRWPFSEEELDQDDFPPTSVCSRVTLHQPPYFEGGNAWLAITLAGLLCTQCT